MKFDPHRPGDGSKYPVNPIMPYHKSDSNKCRLVQGLEPEEWDAVRYLEKLPRGTRALFEPLWRDFGIQNHAPEKMMARQ
jgi:hypothetical protein